CSALIGERREPAPINIPGSITGCRPGGSSPLSMSASGGWMIGKRFAVKTGAMAVLPDVFTALVSTGPGDRATIIARRVDTATRHDQKALPPMDEPGPNHRGRARNVTSRTAAAAVAALALGAAASCSSGTTGPTAHGADTITANYALTGVVNPSTHKGGTLVLGGTQDLDSV